MNENANQNLKEAKKENPITKSHPKSYAEDSRK
uniref:Uncharacterized protein n=1 Tax=Rhizophora mucronata TaxID=61149 RepID=A0A2P2R5A0_RHIMU